MHARYAEAGKAYDELAVHLSEATHVDVLAIAAIAHALSGNNDAWRHSMLVARIVTEHRTTRCRQMN